MLLGMYKRTFENTIFTHWAPATDMVKAAPAKGTSTAPEGVRPGGKRSWRRDHYEELPIVVKFRGGPEASWLITARGVSWRFPGHLCLHDVLAAVVF
jgi:hypothetical protein